MTVYCLRADWSADAVYFPLSASRAEKCTRRVDTLMSHAPSVGSVTSAIQFSSLVLVTARETIIFTPIFNLFINLLDYDILKSFSRAQCSFCPSFATPISPKPGCNLTGGQGVKPP